VTCREVADFLADYVSGALPPDVRTVFERHLRVCPNCQAYLATYRATMTLCASAFAVQAAEPPDDVPRQLVDAILDSLRG
jgi:anti-sigma factor RsiW